MNTASPTDDIAFEKGSGTPYADIGLPNAEEMLLKAELVDEMEQIIQIRNLTHQHAAEFLGVPEATLSDLLRGKFRTISRMQIIDYLNRLTAV